MSEEGYLLGKCDDFSAAEPNLFDLVLRPTVKEALFFLRIHHNIIQY